MTNVKTPPPINKQFVRSVQAGLTYWHKQISHLNNHTIQRLDKEHQNLYRIVEMGLKFSDTRPDAISLITQLYDLIEKRGYWQEWILILKRAIAKSSAKQTSLKCQLYNQLGTLQRLDRQLDAAIASHEKAEKWATKEGTPSLLAQTHLNLSNDYLQLRQYEQSEEYGRLALKDFAKQDKKGRGMADSYKILGAIALEQRHLQDAALHLEEAVAIWRTFAQEDPVGLGRVLNDQGRLLIEMGEPKQALTPLFESKKLFDTTANEFDKTLLHINFGMLYFEQEEWQKAEAAFRQANSPYLRRSGHLYLRALIANNLGSVLTKRNQYGKAEAYLRESVALWQQIGDDLMRANTLGGLGEVLQEQGNLEAAKDIYDKAITLLQEFPQSGWARQLSNEYWQQQKLIQQSLLPTP